ncbi:uncharacterized protein LOC121406032 [Lytechinus variegatus]|uniref:uncharacterized protein LOC121406032 n=1 Tax=Lytechinus variegatus TaxID=7654 RepID=UPI001BB1DA4F|nr:uncharacterized protein LOC121406032 [Lytechinus variegatus]
MRKSNEDARSSQIFFTARVKNKREDTKLKYEMKLLEREFGHTIFSIHKDIRDLKAELKVTKRSSGHSAEGWFAGDDDESVGNISSRRTRSTKSAEGIRRRTNVLERHRKQDRVTSAPPVRNHRDHSMGSKVTKTPDEEKVRQDNHVNSKSTGGEVRLSRVKSLITQKHSMRPSATKIVPAEDDCAADASLRIDAHCDKDEPLSNENRSADTENDFSNETISSRVESASTSQPMKKNSFLNPIAKTNWETEFASSSVNDHPAHLQPSQAESDDERPLSPMIKILVKDRWLKPSLKKRSNGTKDEDIIDRPKKTVRIAPNSSNFQSDFQKNHTNNATANQAINHPNTQNIKQQNSKKSPTFLTSLTESIKAVDHQPYAKPMSLGSGALPSSNMSKGESMKKSVNVIPDVRKKVLSLDEIKMKRKRDNLLASSVSALLTGKVLGQRNKEEISENGKEEDADDRPGSGTERGRSPSPKLRRRFSFGTIAQLAMNQHKAFPVEKKATLGSRLKLKTPAEESERNIQIHKSVLVNDSDSDDDNHKNDYTPAKPAIDLKNVKSKISNQWNQDAVLEKPPTLADDTFQLQRSLAAAHISRGRDLRDMQDDNEVDPVKVIDDDRKSALVLKLKAFNKLLVGGDKQEKRRKSVMDAIHAGTDGKQILKLMRLANKE